MSPALIRSALLWLLQTLSLAACTTSPETKFHLVPEPSRGAMIAVAPASSAAMRATMSPSLDASIQHSRAQQSIAGATPTVPGMDQGRKQTLRLRQRDVEIGAGNEFDLLRARGDQLVAQVASFKALGGGWTAAEIAQN